MTYTLAFVKGTGRVLALVDEYEDCWLDMAIEAAVDQGVEVDEEDIGHQSGLVLMECSETGIVELRHIQTV
jgi:hypothetical protein